ncbi:condensin complex subunit 2/barren [Geopyxis carbonaria]|nr:condensin complex subunit 2/barren [Geopyxis carbonaria]
MARIRGSRGQPASAAASTPIRIPLNDDAEEKAKRLEKRTALQDMQKQKMKAAASPAAGRRATLSGKSGNEASPNTPRNVGRTGARGADGVDAVTPMRKVPLLSNFEEWLRLASDNKITAENSWDFALIDYFHDMTLLKTESGDGVDFTKASHTLDGCVKIYTSRVDSVAHETGKLLSQLADSNLLLEKWRKGEDEREEGDESDAENEEERPVTKKKPSKSSEATLAKDFESLRIKKLELEFSVDPLFKKASADFDEGGAKGLLLNHLCIDNRGRIVFDSSDDKEEKGPDDGEETQPEEEEPPERGISVVNKLVDLRHRFLPNLMKLDEQHVCPTLKDFDLGDADGVTDIPFLKALEEQGNIGSAAAANVGAGMDDIMERDDMGFGFDDGFGIGAEDDDIGLEFGEGGEAWANMTMANAAENMLSPAKQPLLKGDIDMDASGMGVGFMGQEDILSYFDEALKKNWAGPEHWRVRRIKDNSKPAAPVRERKEKEAFTIDFMSPEADIPDSIFAEPKTASTIALQKKDRESKTRNLLPDDKHFNSRQLLKLFTKPKASLSKRRKIGNSKEEPENLDEEFWAKENLARELQASSTPDRPVGNYDANFFNDDNLNLPPDDDDDGDGDVFADAQEGFSPAMGPGDNPPLPSNAIPSTEMPFGSQLVTQSRRTRPEYVQYARVAKKVDVHKLKMNIWGGLGFEAPQPPPDPQAQEPPPPTPLINPEEPRMFTQVIKDLRGVYPEKTMSDISTSYCFICLLHLANERGLKIDEVDDSMRELRIVKDLTATVQDNY